jgi:hypothetical protein
MAPLNPQSSEPSEADKDREILLKQFRAYLHLAITAHQTGQAKKLEAMDGPNMLTYCRELAELPGNTLAWELALPVTAILDQISKIAPPCEGTLRRKDEKSAAMHAMATRILEQFDLALGFILGSLSHQISFRGEVTKDTDLLCGVLVEDTKAGGRIARMLRRFYQLHPEEDGTDGSFVESFAWDVYQRVMELDKLADEYPDHIRQAARQMHAWPMLMHRHTSNRRRFQQLADRLELGAEYPTDASEGARFRPDTPLVRYLEPIIHRLHAFCFGGAIYYGMGGQEFESAEQENESIRRTWRVWPEDLPGEDIVQILRIARRLPPLTKTTAVQWAEKALVPLILVTDARDWTKCTEPVLQKIARQKGVKSKATFKSRLLAAVIATLRRLARPA